MSFTEIILIGVGLSMDAAAVCMSNSMILGYKNIKKAVFMPLLFSLFQGLMPILGHSAGSIFSDIISKYSGLAVFLILVFIGLKMIKEALSNDDDKILKTKITYKLLIVQAIATSVDAFAVGIGFIAAGIKILPAAFVISLTTLFCSFVSLFIGLKCGDVLGRKAEIAGGIILIAIGIKALI